PDGVREPLHGHPWKVTAAVAAGNLDTAGLAIDFCVLLRHLEGILGPLMGQNLEQCEPFIGINASAERVAQYVFGQMAGLIIPPTQLIWVEVMEAAGCRVRYEP
ncbi:MAG: 6-carboxytetrahydropterin synthase, partial [Sedimentisphaerales bacterium]|nr:6-carboxytetrahydropterin synthase [Sedimentisphaerales bacterium]